MDSFFLLLCAIFFGSAHLEPFDSESSDLNRIKSMKLTFTDTNETLEWPLELEDMAEYAIQTNTFIKFDLNASHPVTFILSICDSSLMMSKTTPFTQSTLYLDGPWLEYFKEPKKHCEKEQDPTLEVYFGPNPTTGFIAFSQYFAFVPQEDSGNQTTSIPLDVTGTRKHMVSMKEYLSPQNHTSPTNYLFLTKAPVRIPFAFGKCGLDAVQYTLEPSEAMRWDGLLIKTMLEYTHVYCPEKPYRWMLELSTTTPSDTVLPAGSAFLITAVPTTLPDSDGTMINVLIILSILMLIFILSFIAFFDLPRLQNSLRATWQ